MLSKVAGKKNFGIFFMRSLGGGSCLPLSAGQGWGSARALACGFRRPRRKHAASAVQGRTRRSLARAPKTQARNPGASMEGTVTCRARFDTNFTNSHEFGLMPHRLSPLRSWNPHRKAWLPGGKTIASWSMNREAPHDRSGRADSWRGGPACRPGGHGIPRRPLATYLRARCDSSVPG